MAAMGSFNRRQFTGIEVAHIADGTRGFAPHFHDEFVISVNVRGWEKIKLDRKCFDAAEGDVTLYNPAQVQSSHVISESWQFASMYVDPVALPVLLGIHPETVFDKPLLQAPGIAARLRGAILSALNRNTPESVAQEGLVHVFDELLQMAGSGGPATSRHVPASIGGIADRLRDDPALPTLTDLAASAGMTPVQLVRAFSKAYGMPPLAWRCNQRVVAARKRIAQGENIAAVALDLGFADQSHLTRRFRAVVGVPPGQWRDG